MVNIAVMLCQKDKPQKKTETGPKKLKIMSFICVLFLLRNSLSQNATC